MTKLSMYDEKEYFIDYENGNIWAFTSLNDLFEELDRIKENTVYIFINFLTGEQHQKIWKRLYTKAKRNGFFIKIYNDQKTGVMERKNKI